VRQVLDDEKAVNLDGKAVRAIHIPRQDGVACRVCFSKRYRAERHLNARKTATTRGRIGSLESQGRMEKVYEPHETSCSGQ
jgi:hypothetical protein